MVKIFKLLIFIFMIVGLACCKQNNEPDEPGNSTEETKDAESEKGTDIPFVEYSLVETSSRWTSLNPDSDKQFILVNSDKELQKYIAGTDYPPVDFSKQTLLLASGRANYGIAEIVNSLQQLSADKYKWTVEITLKDTTLIEDWTRAILTDKLNEKREVELYVDTIR